jgi:cytochrome P450
MTAQTVRELPLQRGGNRLRPRLPLDDLAGSPERLIAFRYPNGVAGYLTTTAEDFRAILNDPRFHAKRFLGEPQASPVSVSVPDMPGFIPSMNGPEHLRVRRLAAGDFSVKHIRGLRPRIEAVVRHHLDQVERHGPPVDLYAEYCLTIPSEVIAGILGVPTDRTEEFQVAARLTIGGLPDKLADPQAPSRAVARLHEIIGEVIERKREEPADDLITRLTAADPPLSDTEIKGLCTNLLLAGHETTATSSAIAIPAP